MKRIDEIVKLRQELLDELHSIQDNCNHDEYHIGTYSWRVGSYDQMRICIDCGKCLDNASNEELEDFKTEYIDKEKEKLKEKNGEEPKYYFPPTNIIYQATKIYKRN